jgi:hypothetical protein
MSDRPSAINGKRNQAWGTLRECPACGQCLCFGCHPAGPCLDDHDEAATASFTDTVTYASAGFTLSGGGAWLASGAENAPGASGLRMRATFDGAGERLR